METGESWSTSTSKATLTGAHAKQRATGFAIHYLGTCIHFASRTQAVVALSSAESELYAVCTACTEGLYTQLCTGSIRHRNKPENHTDSSAAKSITMREGTSKKAKHIELKHLFVQQLVKHGLISTHKIRSEHNPADILTKAPKAPLQGWSSRPAHILDVTSATAVSHMLNSM